MQNFFSRNIQFVVMLLIWVAAGQIATPVALGVIAVSVLLLKRRDYYSELIIGFIFILMLSDSRQPLFEFAKNVKDVYLLLLTGFFFFDRKNFNIKNSLIIPFIPFVIWAFAMTFRSPEFQVAFQKTLSYTLLYLVIPSYFTKGFRTHGPLFLKDFIFMVHTMLIIGLILAVANPNFVFLAGRYCSMLGNPNGIGIYGFLMVILVVCTQIKFPDLFSKKELIWIYLIIAISVIMSGSRNAIMCIGIFLAFTKFYRVSYWYGFVTVIISVMLYQVVFANLPTILQMLGLAKALRADTLEDGSGRMVAWLFALKQLNTNLLLFIFGGGFSFDEYIFYLNRHALSALGHQGGVHNTYLAMWLNTGIIGLVLWFTGFMRTIFKAVTISYSAFPIMYSVLFSAFFEAWLMGSLNPYHITFLLIFTLITTDKSEFAEMPSEFKGFKPGMLK